MAPAPAGDSARASTRSCAGPAAWSCGLVQPFDNLDQVGLLGSGSAALVLVSGLLGVLTASGLPTTKGVRDVSRLQNSRAQTHSSPMSCPSLAEHPAAMAIPVSECAINMTCMWKKIALSDCFGQSVVVRPRREMQAGYRPNSDVFCPFCGNECPSLAFQVYGRERIAGTSSRTFPSWRKMVLAGGRPNSGSS